MVFPTPGHFLVLASRLTYENMAYRWSYTISCLPSPSLRLKHRGLAIPTYDPSAVPSLQMADGSEVTFFAPLIYLIFLTSSTSVTDGQFSSPQHVPSLRAPLLVRLLLVLLSQYLPSRVTLRYEMVGTVAGDGAPRFLSVIRSSGVCWTRLVRSLTVPLLGSVPSRCRCFTLRCAQ